MPNTGPKSKEREALIRKLRRDLARFQRVPASNREAECADEGEQLCGTLLSELEDQEPRDV